MSFDTSITLLQRIKQPENADAWEQFHELYGPLLSNFFLSNGLQKTDADDLTQEVLRRIARAMPEFRYDPEKGRFRSWLYRIARNEFNRFLAQRRRKQSIEIPQGEHLPPAKEEAELERRWNLEYGHHVFNWACRKVRPNFSENAWNAFWRTVVDGISSPEVAEELGVEVGTVYVSKSKIIARIREEVTQISGEKELRLE